MKKLTIAIVGVLLITIIAIGTFYTLQQPPKTGSPLPSSSPTTSPTTSPTVLPTAPPLPTAAPTVVPTSSPTPSLLPTVSPTSSPTPQPTVSPSPTALPVTVIDDANRTVTFTSYPNRIISLAPSCTEIIVSLGLQNRTVGTVSYSGYSQSVKDWMTKNNITVVGTYSKINVEAVAALQPDLVFASGGYQNPTTEKLIDLGIPVIAISPIGFKGVLNDIAIVGNVTGYVTQQQALVADMKSRAQTIMSQTINVTRPRVYVEYYFTAGGLESYGGDSFVNDLIAMAGGANIFGNTKTQYQTTNSEVVISTNPEVAIISNGAMSSLAGLTPDVMSARAGWNEISAVQNHRIYLIDEKLITIGGPGLINGLEALAKAIHPEIFGN